MVMTGVRGIAIAIFSQWYRGYYLWMRDCDRGTHLVISTGYVCYGILCGTGWY